MDGRAAAKNLLIHARPDMPLTDQLHPRKSSATLMSGSWEGREEKAPLKPPTPSSRRHSQQVSGFAAAALICLSLQALTFKHPTGITPEKKTP